MFLLLNNIKHKRLSHTAFYRFNYIFVIKSLSLSAEDSGRDLLSTVDPCSSPAHLSASKCAKVYSSSMVQIFQSSCLFSWMTASNTVGIFWILIPWFSFLLQMYIDSSYQLSVSLITNNRVLVSVLKITYHVHLYGVNDNKYNVFFKRH